MSDDPDYIRNVILSSRVQRRLREYLIEQQRQRRREETWREYMKREFKKYVALFLILIFLAFSGLFLFSLALPRKYYPPVLTEPQLGKDEFEGPPYEAHEL